ncbi:MAG: aspartate--tRNA ligase [Candidatus Omnitrophica bacterium]|nr:aspartate--tRNA ligase [Candidatus Omnitrophota bacterium]
MFRTHTCGLLNASMIGKEVSLAGWVHARRDHGNLIFIDLRDRWGLTQLVFNPETNPSVHDKAEKLRSEFVISIKGKVRHRPAGTENPKIVTGEVEVVAEELEILNESPTPPFEIAGGSDVSEEIRLKYRFLDLRRQELQESLKFRYDVTRVARDYLHSLDFIEVETPYLTKSTPEGARDFLVPSRLSPGTFYALPQSPQLFKQLLMVAGYDRYFQLARCFRDEDLRADRQPEHTQIDMEMSFAAEEDIMKVVEGMTASIFEKLLKKKIPLPFRRIPYEQAIAHYGSDKPDLRFDMLLEDVTDEHRGIGFKIFAEAVERGARIKALVFPTPEGKDFSRKDFDELTRYLGELGALGLVWIKVKRGGEVESPVAKFYEPERLSNLIKRVDARAGNIIFMIADENIRASTLLGALRVHLAQSFLAIPKDRFELCWVTDFPLFEWSEEEKRYVACHHPFTSPREVDLSMLESAPEKTKARAYDLILNGAEIGGGSIRIHRKDVQEKVFKALQLSSKDAEEKFGFLLKALSFGAPPHGGIALGLDRLVTLLLGKDSIREVIAFPKTQKGTCLMTEAPSHVSPKQLKELHLKAGGA